MNSILWGYVCGLWKIHMLSWFIRLSIDFTSFFFFFLFLRFFFGDISIMLLILYMCNWFLCLMIILCVFCVYVLSVFQVATMEIYLVFISARSITSLSGENVLKIVNLNYLIVMLCLTGVWLIVWLCDFIQISTEKC